MLLAVSHKSDMPTIPSLGSVNLLEQLAELREALARTSLLEDKTKSAGEQPQEEVQSPLWEGPEHRQELLSPCTWGASPSWHVDVFTDPEASQTSYMWDFDAGFPTSA